MYEKPDCIYRKKAIKIDLSARNPKNINMKGFICISDDSAYWVLGNDAGCCQSIHCPKYVQKVNNNEM